ncbi:MAG TPA: phosphoribosylformylglycinamidine cyclo-ligase [Dissulfurispiraceae bacterium]|nr:phosphoribosylformylglycinamidine cyclo-ligase [Dissulfurispiraceae bacterium]
MSGLTYKKAGVDIDEGDRFVRMISPLVKKTFRPEVMTDIGSFGGLFALKKYRNPVLVSGTDGVGTKLKIAFMLNRHDSVGIDLVAMCVNDILTSGAEPLFFLDYFATGKLHADRAKDVVKGIAKGCKEAGCALIGGETAEMPGFYEKDEYDLAGFAVGVAEKNRIIDGSAIREGDAIIGLSSSGLHSNGYSLARKVFFEKRKLKIGTVISELGSTIGDELIRPTRIYVNAFKALREQLTIKGMAHITGGGIPGNLPRIFRGKFSAVIHEGSWPVPPVFSLIGELGGVPDPDMKRTFNMGIGYVIVLGKNKAVPAIDLLKKAGYPAYLIGFIEKGGNEKVRYV